MQDVGRNAFQDGYSECFRRLLSSYPDFVTKVLLALRNRGVGIVMNQTRSQADIDIGQSMELICKRYFNLEANFLGALNYEDAAWKSLRNRRLLMHDFPHSMLAKNIGRISNAALDRLGFIRQGEQR